jgi:hypothetical protein
VLTFVGTAGGGDGVGVGVGDGVGVGVGVGVVGIGVEEVLIDEELGTGSVTDEDMGGETPSHVPNALRHPVPQY